MSISAAGDSLTSMASMATSMSGEQVNMQIAVAVMKQAQDVQKTQANGLLQMMNWSPHSGTVGTNVNVSA